MNKNWFSEKSLQSRFRNAYIKNVNFKNYLSALDKESYYIRQNWNKIFKDECVFPSNYFEFAYKIK